MLKVKGFFLNYFKWNGHVRQSGWGWDFLNTASLGWVLWCYLQKVYSQTRHSVITEDEESHTGKLKFHSWIKACNLDNYPSAVRECEEKSIFSCNLGEAYFVRTKLLILLLYPIKLITNYQLEIKSYQLLFVIHYILIHLFISIHCCMSLGRCFSRMPRLI